MNAFLSHAKMVEVAQIKLIDFSVNVLLDIPVLAVKLVLKILAFIMKAYVA